MFKTKHRFGTFPKATANRFPRPVVPPSNDRLRCTEHKPLKYRKDSTFFFNPPPIASFPQHTRKTFHIGSPPPLSPIPRVCPTCLRSYRRKPTANDRTPNREISISMETVYVIYIQIYFHFSPSPNKPHFRKLCPSRRPVPHVLLPKFHVVHLGPGHFM